MRLPRNALVIVADGEKYLALRQHGEGLKIDLTVEDSHAEPAPAHTAEMGTDRPGRYARPASSARETVEQTDLKRLAKEDFAAGLADRLNRGAREGAFDALVLVADARSLGLLRGALDAGVQARLLREIEGDYTGHPVADIAGLLGRTE